MNEILNFFDQLPAWLNTLTAVITAASCVTAATPSKSDDVIVGGALKLLNILSINFGKNKNADDV